MVFAGEVGGCGGRRGVVAVPCSRRQQFVLSPLLPRHRITPATTTQICHHPQRQMQAKLWSKDVGGGEGVSVLV